MALKLVVDKLDDVAETQRSLYVEKEGKFHLDVDGLEDTSGLKTALSAERKARAELDKKIKKWEGLGKSDEEIAALIEQATKDENDKATKAGEWDKLREQMNKKHAEELAKKDAANGKMRTTLEKHLIDAQAIAAITAEKGSATLLLPHVQRHVKVIEDDAGEFVATVVDAKGDPRVDGKGAPMTIQALVAEMKASEEFGRAFDASGQSGSGKQSGSSGGSGGSTGVPKTWADAKTAEEKAAFIKAKQK